MDIEGNISATAVATAYFRSVESRREDRLFADDWASAFVAASGLSADGDLRLPDVTETRLYRSVAARTDYLDRQVDAALAAGVGQVVLLGAGLDTRAFRMRTDGPVTVYEVDLPEILQFKDSVFDGAEPPEGISRVPVAADLSGEWVSALTAAGFDPTTPAAWLVEGVFIYFDDATNGRLVEELTLVSAPGSWIFGAHFGPGSLEEQQTKQMNARVAGAGYGFQSYVDDPAEWLGRWQWDGQAVSLAEHAARVGRDLPYQEKPGAEVAWLFTARRGRGVSPIVGQRAATP